MYVSHHLVREGNDAWSTVVGKVDKDIVIWTTEREQGRVGGRRERGERGGGWMGELFEIFGHNRGNPIKPLLDEHTVINSRPQGEKNKFWEKIFEDFWSHCVCNGSLP